MGEFSKSFSVKNMKPAMFFATLVLAIVAGHEEVKNKKEVSSIDVEILTRNVREIKKVNCRMEDCIKRNGKEKGKGKKREKGKGRTKGKLKRKGKGKGKGKGRTKGKSKRKGKGKGKGRGNGNGEGAEKLRQTVRQC